MADLGRGPTVEAKTGMSEDLPVWQGSRPRAAAARAPVGQEIAQKGRDGFEGVVFYFFFICKFLIIFCFYACATADGCIADTHRVMGLQGTCNDSV